MKARLYGAMALLSSTSAIFIPACAENDSSLAIRGVLTPTLDTCVVTADLAAEQYKNGLIDVAIAHEYQAALLVENQLVPRGDPNRARTETAAIQLYAADVQIQDSGGAAITRKDGSAASYTVPVSGIVDQSSGGLPGLGFTEVLLIDSATTADLAAAKLTIDLVAHVVLHGRTLGGNEVQTGSWAFPIRACYGCSVYCSPKADDPLVPGPDCQSTAENPPANCRPGLDTPTDCRVCRNNPVCACTN